MGINALLAQYQAKAAWGAYRGRDTNLKRDVAIKVLPETFAGDAERIARFQREAEVLASLNHNNMAAICGVEDRALLVELVEGSSPKGPLPFDEAWKIAAQIAAALENAHDKRIIHRDLTRFTLDPAAEKLPGVGSPTRAASSLLPLATNISTCTASSPMAWEAGELL